MREKKGQPSLKKKKNSMNGHFSARGIRPIGVDLTFVFPERNSSVCWATAHARFWLRRRRSTPTSSITTRQALKAVEYENWINFL